MKSLDRGLAVLLFLGGCGHTAGSFAAYAREPFTLLWSLSASVLAFLLSGLNILRTARSGDRALAWLCFAGTLAYLLVTIVFGRLIGNILDPRVIGFAAICAGLLLFSFRAGVAHRQAA